MEEGPTLKLIILQGPLEGKALNFRPVSRIQIGRVVRGNTLTIKEAGISSQHLSIHFDSGKWVVSDLNSSNGTFLNENELDPSAPADLTDGDTIKIGEFTSIKVNIESESVDDSRSRLRQNPRRRAATDTVEVVVENRSRRAGGKAKLGSFDESSYPGLGFDGALGDKVVQNPNRRGRPRKARVLEDDVQETEIEKVEESDNVGPIEVKKERQINLRKTRGSNKAEILSSVLGKAETSKNVVEESKIEGEIVEEMHNVDQIAATEPQLRPRRTRSSQKVDCSVAVEYKKTRKGPKGKKNIQDEPLENVENMVLQEEVEEESNLGQDECEEANQNLLNESLQGERVNVLEEEVREEFGLGRQGCEGLATQSDMKKGGVEVDLVKMTLGDWFNYLEVYLPKEIYDETEELILGMEQKAKQFHEFMLQQKNVKEKGEVHMD